MNEQVTAPDPRLEEIESRLSKATPGPWEAGSLDGHAADVFTVATEEDLGRWVVCEHAGTDAEFIAHAPADVAYLLAELRKAQDKLARVEGLHRSEERWMPYDGADVSYDSRQDAIEAAEDYDYAAEPVAFLICAHCKTIEEGPCDGECTRELGYRESLWPCPTAAAVADATGGGDS